jgi:hypothetical protein
MAVVVGTVGIGVVFCSVVICSVVVVVFGLSSCVSMGVKDVVDVV